MSMTIITSCNRISTNLPTALLLITLTLLMAVTSTQAANIPGVDPPADLPSSPVTDGDSTAPSCGAGGDSCAANSDVGSAPSDEARPGNSVGNPINLMTGNKYQSEVDLQIPGAMLSLKRMYNSGNSDSNLGLGQGWYHSYSVNLFDSGNGTRQIVQSNGARLTFEEQGTDKSGYPLYRSNRSSQGYLTFENKRHYWHLSDGRVLKFNGTFLVEIDWPDQRKLKLFYRSQRLHTVNDETGRVLRFAYSGNTQAEALPAYEKSRFGSAPGYLDSVTLPDGSVIGYDYDDRRNLTRARFPDGTSREYHYEDENYPNHLTGLTDRTGVRFASWGYDGEGRAISSEHAGGVEKVTLQYPERKVAESGAVVETLVSNSLGAQSVYTWQKPAGTGQEQLLSSAGAGCTTCPETGIAYEYDEQGRLLSSSQTLQGNATLQGSLHYFYDEQGRISEINRTDAEDDIHFVERREYEGLLLLPVRSYQPSVNPDAEHITTMEYGSEGLLLSVTDEAYEPDGGGGYRPIRRMVSYHYNNGKMLSIDGPRTDVDDTTYFDYDTSNRLIRITTPDGQSLNLLSFDAKGLVKEIQVGSQRPMHLTYTDRTRVAKIDYLTRSVTFHYDAEGRLISMTDPFGKQTVLKHDEAARLTAVVDNLGRQLRLTHDSESQLIEQSLTGQAGELIRSLDQVFNAKGQLQSVISTHTNFSTDSPVVQSRNFDYDARGNMVALSKGDGSGRSTLSYDPIGQLLGLPNGSVTSDENDSEQAPGTNLSYDNKGQNISLQDDRGNLIRFLKDDFGRVVVMESADMGRRTYTYDAAGNRLSQRDADGNETYYQWDAASRLVEQVNSDGVILYTYDPVSGKLASTSNPSSTESFAYNVDAQLLSHGRVIDGSTFITRYDYDQYGVLFRKVLPDGQSLRYHHYESGPNAGQLQAVTRESLMGMRQETLLAEIDLDERDGASGYLSHNGIRTQRRFTPDGNIESLEIADALNLQYTFDDQGNITGIDENGTVQSYNYRLGALVGANTLSGDYFYQYDVLGNRTSKAVTDSQGQSYGEQYEYPTRGKGNRLLSRTNNETGEIANYGYNTSGSPVSAANDLRYSYNAEQRPVEVYKGSALLAQYYYNSFGERIKKVVYANGVPRVTYFLYDGTQLSAEVEADEGAIANYLYLNDTQLVAKLQDDQVFAIHTDHLGTPRKMSDTQRQIVWEASYTPFGEATLNIDRESLNHRFPGQYADQETGTHYNYYRDYDPQTGRYLTSDPISLAGGVNTYVYANNAPILLSDLLGLSSDPQSATPAIVNKPAPDFTSKLGAVIDYTIARLASEQGVDAVLVRAMQEFKDTAVVLGGIAVALGVGLGVASAVTGGAAMPILLSGIASVAAFVGARALWIAGFEGLTYLYNMVNMALRIHQADESDCAGLMRLGDELFDLTTNAAGTVVSDIVGGGLISGVVGSLGDLYQGFNRGPDLPNPIRDFQNRQCSFEGDTLVLTRDGYRQIRDIEPGLSAVWSKDELTGETGWKTVSDQYSNDYTHRVTVTTQDSEGKRQRIISNRIHPYFAKVAAGILLVVASEGHVYAGDIPGGAWVDAQHLQAGYELQDSDGQWQEVISVEQKEDALEAFNLTVEGFHTYFVAGQADASAVWVHNVCFDAGDVPNGYSSTGKTEFGQETFAAPNGEQLYRGQDGRYYELDVNKPPLPSGFSSDEYGNVIGRRGGVYEHTGATDENGLEIFRAGEDNYRYVTIDGDGNITNVRSPFKQNASATGLHGEREVSSEMMNNGWTPIGNTQHGAADFDDAMAGYEGRNGIDGIFRRPIPGTNEFEYVIIETKSSLSGRAGDLSTLTGGEMQMSQRWLAGHLNGSNTGLEGDDLAALRSQVDSGNITIVKADVAGVSPGNVATDNTPATDPSGGTLTFTQLNLNGRRSVTTGGNWNP